jgi:hypothetical protein
MSCASAPASDGNLTVNLTGQDFLKRVVTAYPFWVSNPKKRSNDTITQEKLIKTKMDLLERVVG